MSDSWCTSPHIAALPMHGEVKFAREGLRTRDSHLLEWVARLSDTPVVLLSRPEPWPRLTAARMRCRTQLPSGWILNSPEVFAVPSIRHRRDWWVRSRRWQAGWNDRTKAVWAWNPLATAHLLSSSKNKPPLIFDLLDDWSIHHQFRHLRKQILESYRRTLEAADAVTANSEATLALAVGFGRSDAKLITNGVDPERFSPLLARQSGPVTVGYAGKLSERLDVDLVRRTVERLPHARFVFAGPTITRSVRSALGRIRGIDLLGDVHYDNYPKLLTTWDIGWVPHRVADGEIGGDVLKIYEFRASGLPTFITPIIGSDRALEGVRVYDRMELPSALEGFVGRLDRIPREVMQLDTQHRWESKARCQMALLGLLPAPLDD